MIKPVTFGHLGEIVGLMSLLRLFSTSLLFVM